MLHVSETTLNDNGRSFLVVDVEYQMVRFVAITLRVLRVSCHGNTCL